MNAIIIAEQAYLSSWVSNGCVYVCIHVYMYVRTCIHAYTHVCHVGKFEIGNLKCKRYGMSNKVLDRYIITICI